MAEDVETPSTELVVNVSGINLGLGRLIGNVVGPPAAQAAGILTDLLGTFRFEMSLKLLARARRKIEEAGLEHEPVGPVSLPKVLPMLESGSVETDESLQDRWAGLLANAVLSPEAVPPSFAEILRQLSAHEAALIDRFFDAVMQIDEPSDWRARRGELPHFGAAVGLEGQALQVAQENLARLGLCFGEPLLGGGESFDSASLTVTGYAFVRACRGPIAVGSQGTGNQ
jgi:hypothetical protein